MFNVIVHLNIYFICLSNLQLSLQSQLVLKDKLFGIYSILQTASIWVSKFENYFGFGVVAPLNIDNIY